MASGVATLVAVLLIAGTVTAQTVSPTPVTTKPNLVTAVPRVTGSDPAALAKRLQMLEDRVDNMWSVRQGPDVLGLDTVDRLASRLLAVEARLATLEKGGAGSTQALAVATSLSLLAATDFRGVSAAALGAGPQDVQRLRYLVALAKLTPWPPELTERARSMADALQLTLKAFSRGEKDQAHRLATEADRARLQLMAAGLGWTARAAAPNPAHAHMDHSSRHGGQLAMRGDLHIEAVLRRAGESWTFDVYLSDATRTPIWPDAFKGDIVLWPDDAREVIVPLAVAGERLTGKSPAGPGTEPVDLRIRLDGSSQGHVEMDFRIPVIEK